MQIYFQSPFNFCNFLKNLKILVATDGNRWRWRHLLRVTSQSFNFYFIDNKEISHFFFPTTTKKMENVVYTAK